MLTYFPLRSNAHGMLSGQHYTALIERIKIASLLGDVVLQDGLYTVNAGDGGSSAWLEYDVDPSRDHPQTPHRRGSAQKGGFGVAIAVESGTQHAVLASNGHISWSATFGPIRRQLPHAYEWLTFAPIQLNDVGTRAAKAVKAADEAAGTLANEPLGFVRSRLLEHVSEDTVAGATLDAAVAMDRRHSQIVGSRLRGGEALAVPSFAALQVLQPNVGALTWDDIDQLRRLRGWSELRDVYGEVGVFAFQFSGSLSEFKSMVHQEFDSRVQEAALKLEGPKGVRKWLGTGFGLAVGSLTSLISLPPLAGVGTTVATTVLGAVVDWTQREPTPRWRAAYGQFLQSMNARLAAPESRPSTDWSNY